MSGRKRTETAARLMLRGEMLTYPEHRPLPWIDCLVVHHDPGRGQIHKCGVFDGGQWLEIVRGGFRPIQDVGAYTYMKDLKEHWEEYEPPTLRRSTPTPKKQETEA